MRYIILIIIIFELSAFRSKAQDQTVSVTLDSLFSRLAKSRDDIVRNRINDSIITIIDGYALSDSVFEHNFTNLRYLGQITADDDNLKIITWNLILNDRTNSYYCYIIHRGEKGEKNILYKLIGKNSPDPILTNTEYTEKNWYGALYYDIRPVKIKKELIYVLLGVDFGNNPNNRKIIDVMSFTDKGLVFGRKWFQNGDDIRQRVVFEYDATGSMSLNFRTDKSIVFDHLVPIAAGSEGITYGAEFSFDSYNFKNGIWTFERNIDVRNKKD
jgi:hypothetical protein